MQRKKHIFSSKSTLTDGDEKLPRTHTLWIDDQTHFRCQPNPRDASWFMRKPGSGCDEVVLYTAVRTAKAEKQKRRPSRPPVHARRMEAILRHVAHALGWR